MTREHIKDKFFGRVDRVAFRLPDDLKEELFQFAKERGLLDAEYTSDIIIAFMKSKDGVGKVEIEGEDNDSFDCNKLCAKARGCTLEAMHHLGEIRANNCYVPNYPKYCWFLMWEGSPHGDPDHPLPRCLDPKPPVELPKDDHPFPQICWACMKIKKHLKEAKTVKKAIRDDYIPYRPAKVYYPSEGNPWRHYRE